MHLSNKTYDVLNSLVKVVLPAFGTLYFTLAQIWGLPAAEAVVATIVATCLFLGVVVQIAKAGWKTDDDLMIDASDPNEINFGFKSGLMVDELKDGQSLTLRVHKSE